MDIEKLKKKFLDNLPPDTVLYARKIVRLILLRERETFYPAIYVIDDFDEPVETFIKLNYELVLDTIIDARDWPEDFPMGFELRHNPDSIAKSGEEYEWVKDLENQWDSKPEEPESNEDNKL